MKGKKKYYVFEIDVLILNIICTLIMVLLFGVSYLFFRDFVLGIFDNINIVNFIILYLLYMVLHEIIHSVGYVLYGGDFKKIVYGVQLESGVFYCLCKQNIKRKNILNSLLFPLFYLGGVTYILSFIFNSYYLLVLSIFNIAGCAGDIMMFIYISRLGNDIEYTEMDNPIRFAIYSKDDVSKVSHFGLKYIECCDNVLRDDLRKVRISKFSYVILVLVLIWCLIFNLL